jgi:hypothetical protein
MRGVLGSPDTYPQIQKHAKAISPPRGRGSKVRAGVNTHAPENAGEAVFSNGARGTLPSENANSIFGGALIWGGVAAVPPCAAAAAHPPNSNLGTETGLNKLLIGIYLSFFNK